MRYRWLVAILLITPLLAIGCGVTTTLYIGSAKLDAWQAQRTHQAGAGAPTALPQTGHELAQPLQNMRDLAQHIAANSGREQGQYQPIEIVRIGEQDYLIVIAGTQLDSQGGNNVESAGQEVTKQSSPYLRHIRTLIQQHIPRGSTLHFAGHSLGGMVANTLAATPELLEHYTVKSVTTFGTPVNACANPKVEYHRYVVEGDLVPLVHRAAIWSRVKGPLAVLKSECAEGYAYLDQTLIDHSAGPNGLENAHSSYEESQDLLREELPFPIDRYESIGRFLATPQPK